MSDAEKPKPFAEVVNRSGDGEWWRLWIADSELVGHFLERTAHETADRINAAVEAREAKLVGGWRDLARRLWKSYNGATSGGIHEPWFALQNALLDLEKNDGPDYVPANEAAAFAMRAAELELRCELLTDALAAFDEGRRADLVPFLRARGWAEKEPL